MEKVIIIGSGPAGLTAAIYAARANLHPLCIEGVAAGGPAGGQLMITTDVENYPGFPHGVQGPDLMKMFRDQAERFGTRFVTADVDRLDLSERPFKVYADGTEYVGHTVIASTGASARWLGLESEQALNGRGVSACATCDGFFFRDQDVVVVGGGDTAMEEALYLTNMCKSVTVVHRRDSLRASKIMQERALEHDKISFLWDSVITEVMDPAKGTVTGVKIQNVKTGEEKLHECQGLFVAIGHTPNTQLFRDWLECDDQGYVLTKPGTPETNIEGVFVAGDAQDKVWRQAVTAAGTGCSAAISAERWLGENRLI
ncbi:MAG: thioredoxin-disulfide reductase [Myxococcota bacterium]